MAILQIVLKGIPKRFGVLAEQVGLQDFIADSTQSGAETGGQTALGKLHLDEQGVFQIVDPPSLVSEDRQAFSFPARRSNTNAFRSDEILAEVFRLLEERAGMDPELFGIQGIAHTVHNASRKRSRIAARLCKPLDLGYGRVSGVAR